jgi:hypothetical protein
MRRLIIVTVSVILLAFCAYTGFKIVAWQATKSEIGAEYKSGPSVDVFSALPNEVHVVARREFTPSADRSWTAWVAVLDSSIPAKEAMAKILDALVRSGWTKVDGTAASSDKGCVILDTFEDFTTNDEIPEVARAWVVSVDRRAENRIILTLAWC